MTCVCKIPFRDDNTVCETREVICLYIFFSSDLSSKFRCLIRLSKLKTKYLSRKEAIKAPVKMRHKTEDPRSTTDNDFYTHPVKL